MNNVLVFPMVLPVLTGILLIFLRPYIRLQRWLSMLSVLGTGAMSIILLQRVQASGILTIDIGGWQPPFGILFVGDSFALLLVLTASIVTAVCLLYAFSTIGPAHEQMHVYAFIQFLLAGVNGSFLTGDLFNLFVCFEVMLLASYILASLGGKRKQLRESLKYVIINILSSWIFLVAIAYLYGAVGTLNMAHLSERIAESGQTPLLTTISMLFLIVFSLKAGLVLYFWLPGTYSAPPTAIAALFGALLTKVGVYAMFRVFTLLFYHEPSITHTWIGIMAAITLIGGSIGAISSKDVRVIVSYNVVIAVGFMMVGLAAATSAALEGSIYYLIHDMLVKALLFLLAGTMIALTGKSKFNEMSGLIRNYPLLGWLFFIGMLSLAGIPPFSGFIGKVLIGKGTIEAGTYILLALAFVSSILVLYSLLRVFRNAFWGETVISLEEEKPLKKSWLVPSVLLAIGTIVLGLGVEVLAPYVQDAANVLLQPKLYIDAVFQSK
ncbi:Na+/H+ antiporter subunit D [Ornithinibacillus gellani]|uniref:Na+/H+ antiporter subunit D n=1 Tax=Ornithinibacillus gellani TaxID=2293253 RepID=UPI000F497BEA|nr:Na+/H+ antiporter subunit D [Ornithinibacillus gellani]TQS71099.1 Na+/H+ antiporter subunit D [Ornithinibacillus gellani]